MEPADRRALEVELARLPDVRVARIVADASGRPTAVHVVASPGKHPKQVVRDVQSVALASFGVDLDRRVVSVVQLDEEAARSTSAARVENASPTPRTVLCAIDDHTGTDRATVRVTLRRRAEEAVGRAEGGVASHARARLVATATLAALAELVPAVASFELDTAQVLTVGRGPIALVTLVRVVPPAEERHVGAAVVRQRGDADAVARAVLDATNRRLPALS